MELRSLARELGEAEPKADANQVSKWERGVRRPDAYYRPRLCIIFDAVPEELGWPSAPRLMVAIGELQARRDAARQAALSDSRAPVTSSNRRPRGSAYPGVDLDRLAAVLHYHWPVDGPLMDGLERAGRHLDYRADLESPSAVLPDLETLLSTIEHLLTRPQVTTARRLKTVGARAAHQIAYLYFIQARQEDAFRFYAVSETLAREASNDLELATTLVGKNGIYLPHDMPTAVQVTETAAHLLHPGAPSGLVSWIWGERAMQEAELGHELEARKFLDLMSASAQSDPAGLNLFAPDMPASWLDRRPAVVALKLGFPREAVAILERNHQVIDPRFTRERTLNLIERGAASGLLGELEAATHYLMDAVDLSWRTDNPRSIRLAQGVRQEHLSRWSSHPLVKRLDEAARSALERVEHG